MNSIMIFWAVCILSAVSAMAQYAGWNENTGENNEERESNLARRADLARQQAENDRIGAENAKWQAERINPLVRVDENRARDPNRSGLASMDQMRFENAEREQQGAERQFRESEYRRQQAEQELHLFRMNSTGNTDEY